MGALRIGLPTFRRLPGYDTGYGGGSSYPGMYGGGGSGDYGRYPSPDNIRDSEFNYVNDYFNGNTAADLTHARDSYRDTVMGRLDRAGTDLGDLRTASVGRSNALLDSTRNDLSAQLAKYGSDANSLITGLDTNLTGQRAAYLGKAQGGINQEVTDRNKMLSDTADAQRTATDIALGQQSQANAASAGIRGGGASSFNNRMQVGVRQKANSDLANLLAQLRQQNYDKTRGEQTQLDAADAQGHRQDTLLSYGDRSRLTDTLAQRQQANTGFLYGEGSKINDYQTNAAHGDYNALLGDHLNLDNNLNNNQREDDRYVRENEARFMGARVGMLPRRPNHPRPFTSASLYGTGYL